MSRAKGYKPSSEHHRKRFGAVHAFLAGALNFPPAASLSQHAPPVMDQGETSSCGGHGTAVGVAIALAAKGKPLPFVPSPKGIYDDARCVEREVLADGHLAPLTDEGIDPATLLEALSTCGVRAIRAPTSDGRYSDCEPKTINEPETMLDDEEAGETLIVGEHAIDPEDPDFPRLVAACIANKQAPVGVGICADGAFETWGDDWKPGKAPLDGAPRREDADHWVVVLAYRTAKDGSLEFLIRNSWGEGWGCPDDAKSSGGCIWVTAHWLQRSCAEAIAFDVEVEVA